MDSSSITSPQTTHFATQTVDITGTSASSLIHIRLQQRNRKKSITTLQGLPADINHDKLLTTFKKRFCCNGSIAQDPVLGKIVTMQGDHRQGIIEFLVTQNIAKRDTIKVHGT